MAWFRRRPRNRSRTRHHVLDVKVSVEQRRHSRLRWFGVAFGTTCLAGLLIFFVWKGGDWTMQRLIFQNSAFAVQEIQVDSEGLINQEQIRRWAGARIDDNLFALDLGRIKRDLEYVPLIRFAEVERAFPHTLRVRVVEREPVAQFLFLRSRSDGGTDPVVFWLDEEGVVIPQIPAHQRISPGPSNDRLPVITGIPPSEVRPGKRIESPQVLSALRLITAFDRSEMTGFAEVREVNAGYADSLILQTQQHAQVVFGLRQFEQQLRRWRGVYDFGHARGLHLATLDLSVANNVPARWLEASEASLIKPPSLKPARLKKRHV